MKGFQQKTESNGMFFTVKHNSIVRESKTPQEGFEAVTTLNPRTGEEIIKYIQRYNTIEALITKIEWYDTEQRYDFRYRGWKVHLDAEGKHGVLDIPFSSRTASRFMKLAENIEFTKPVEFRAWKDSRSDSTAFFVGQEGQSVPQKYTRDSPGECPPPVEKFGGKWSYDDQEEFLYNRMVNVVIPRVNAAHAATEMREEAPAEETHDEPPETETEKKADILKSIKSSLAELAEEDKSRTKTQLLEEWFGERAWSKVEQLPVDMLAAQSKKMLDALVPF